jgi:septal ring-binding cell division protein DamX
VPADSKRVEVLYGTFADRGEAGAALAALPASITQFRPFVRSLDGIRDDARRATARP